MEQFSPGGAQLNLSQQWIPTTLDRGLFELGKMTTATRQSTCFFFSLRIYPILDCLIEPNCSRCPAISRIQQRTPWGIVPLLKDQLEAGISDEIKTASAEYQTTQAQLQRNTT